MSKGLTEYIRRCTENCKDRSPKRRALQLAVNEIARAIETPLEKWPGNCHVVADRILKAGLFSGKLQYGMYYGDVHKYSMFNNCAVVNGFNMIRHGWILSRGTVIDPTRWVFEFVTPYLYIAPHDPAVYDCGMTSLRSSLRTPFESLDLSVGVENSKRYEVPLHLQQAIARVTNSNLKTLKSIQLFWIANEIPDVLGDDAGPIYSWLNSLGLKAAIPVDFWSQVME